MARNLVVEGVRQKDLDYCVSRIDQLVSSLNEQKIDRWAIRAALLKALSEDADRYFSATKGTFREIAAFDNGVARALDESDPGNEKSSDLSSAP